MTGWETDTANDSLNFIALIENQSDDILLLAVNDSPEVLDDSASSRYYVHFPDRNGLRYTEYYVAGFDVDGFDVSSPDLEINFYEMPGYTASLYWFEHD